MESLKNIWKVGRWLVLAGLVVVIFLMLQTPTPVAAPRTPAQQAEEGKQFQAKLQQLAEAQQAGESTETRLTGDELNAALAQASAEVPKQAGTDLPPIQTTQVFFHDDVVVGQFTTQLYGKDVTVTVSGRLGTKDGYVTFAPTEFRIGDMPVPVSMVDSALQKKLAENRDKLKLPDFVADVRVVNGELVVVNK